MSLEKITEEKYWKEHVRDAKDIQIRLHMSESKMVAIDFLYGLGCHIDYYWDTKHHTTCYQPYMPVEDE